MRFVEFPGCNEWRPHQHGVLNTGQPALRTRLEQRLFAGGMELRLRQRVQASFSLLENSTLVMATEVLGWAQTGNSGEDARMSDGAPLFVRRRVARQLEAGIGYLLILTPRQGRPDRQSRVPQIALTVRPWNLAAPSGPISRWQAVQPGRLPGGGAWIGAHHRPRQRTRAGALPR